jgi:hypothetical protein
MHDPYRGPFRLLISSSYFSLSFTFFLKYLLPSYLDLSSTLYILAHYNLTPYNLHSFDLLSLPVSKMQLFISVVALLSTLVTALPAVCCPKPTYV